MRKTIYKKFSTTQLHTLPVERFDGRIVDINSRVDAIHAVRWLMRQRS